MAKRAGVTEKISVSLRRSDLAALRQRAKRLYDGNVSAVIAELAADAALLEGMHHLIDRLGGSTLTEGDRKALDREWATRAPARGKRARARRPVKAA